MRSGRTEFWEISGNVFVICGLRRSDRMKRMVVVKALTVGCGF